MTPKDLEVAKFFSELDNIEALLKRIKQRQRWIAIFVFAIGFIAGRLFEKL